MERKHKITIPEPCHENWGQMTPSENGRFCMSCSKTVIDFTSMLPEEIQHYFIQNQNEKICGRFKKSQLDSITIQIPNRILYSQTNYYKIFLLALFVTMGTTLFSCADKDGNKKKIEKVEIVENPSTESAIIVGKAPINSQNSSKAVLPPPPPPKVDHIKFKKPVPTHCGKIIYEKDKSSSKINDRKAVTQDSITEGDIYITGAVIETKADFPNGMNAFYEFFIREFKMPETVESVKNRIMVSFVVEKDGSLTSFQFPKDVDSQIESEIIRVLNLCPKWIPGEQNGKKTREKISFPLAF